MKAFVFSLVFVLAGQICFSQACGQYRLKYAGTVQTGSLQVENIQVPGTFFLHSRKGKIGGEEFVEAALTDHQIELQIGSHTTSLLTDDPQLVLKHYQRRSATLPVVFTITKKDHQRKMVVEIPWDDIAITLLEDDGRGHLFQIDLGSIKL